MRRWLALLPLVLSTTLALAAAEPAADPCSRLTWNLRHERDLFLSSRPPMDVGAGANPAEAPVIEAGRLYRIHAVPEDVVEFTAPRGRELLLEDGHGGLLRFRVKEDALYRISLDTNFWVDVARNGERLHARGAQVADGCTTPQKVVEIDLPANTELVLQLSGAADVETKLAITEFPPQRLHKGKPRRGKRAGKPSRP